MEEQNICYDCLIQDKILEPFYIKIKEESFELYKRNEREEQPDKFQGCYSDYEQLLKKIAHLKVIKPKHTLEFKEFLNRYQQEMRDLLLLIPKIKL